MSDPQPDQVPQAVGVEPHVVNIGNTAVNEAAQRVGALLEEALENKISDKANADRIRGEFQQAVQQLNDAAMTPQAAGPPAGVPGGPGVVAPDPTQPVNVPVPGTSVTSGGVAPLVAQPTNAMPPRP